MAETFQEFIKSDRQRLNTERKALVAQQRELEKKLAGIDRELAAISAYETTKSGKAATPAPVKPAVRRSAPKRSSGTGRRGSKRDAILAAVKGSTEGMTRGDILSKLGVKGNRAGEMSVSNALTALTKSKQLARKDGKYVPAAA